MLKLGAAGQDVQGDVQDMVGLVVGAMVFEQMQVVIDVSDQSSPACQQSMAMPPGPDRLDPIAQFVVDVVGGDHGGVHARDRAVFDAAEDSPLASL